MMAETEAIEQESVGPDKLEEMIWILLGIVRDQGIEPSQR